MSAAGGGPGRSPTPPAKRLLLVEDDRQVADTIVLLLTVDRHSVDIAADGVEALDRMQATSYDAILCDVRMPRLDGPGLYGTLRRQRPELAARMGFVTATSNEPATREFLATTGAPWIEKPATLEDLRDLIRRLTGD
jgi:two-component system NtrC family sensor kinase